MKDSYTAPVLEIIAFESEDVITDSTPQKIEGVDTPIA